MGAESPRITRDAPVTSLAPSLVAGASSPLAHAALTALSDMGMSVDQIARYLLVSPGEVARLLEAEARS